MKLFEIKSFTDPSKIYHVVHNSNGSWTCSCELNFYKKVKCDHIRKAQHRKLKYHGRQKIRRK